MLSLSSRLSSLSRSSGMSSQRRLHTLRTHLLGSRAAYSYLTQPSDPARDTAALFLTDPCFGWDTFCAIPSWSERTTVVAALRTLPPKAWHAYLHLYRQKMEPYVEPAFYTMVNDAAAVAEWRARYDASGEINVRFLRQACLASLAAYADGVEHMGKARYVHRSARVYCMVCYGVYASNNHGNVTSMVPV